MATIQFKKGDEYLAKISELELSVREEVIGPAIYQAGQIAADAIADEIPRVPTDESWGSQGDPKRGPKKAELRAVYNGLGIAKARNDNGFYNVKIGFDGYDKIPTKRWPKGRPIQMLARSIERGTTFMKPNPFVKKAMAKIRTQALEKMKTTVDAEIEKIMKGT